MYQALRRAIDISVISITAEEAFEVCLVEGLKFHYSCFHVLFKRNFFIETLLFPVPEWNG